MSKIIIKVQDRNLITLLEKEPLVIQPITTKHERARFNRMMRTLHYAGIHKPIGRDLKAWVKNESNHIIGGYQLGSSLPWIAERDQFFELEQFKNGIKHPLDSTADYWFVLQSIANLYRMFVVPEYQGNGFGKEIVRIVESEGVRLFERKYDCKIYGLEVFVHPRFHPSSLFLENGYQVIGRTRGYTKSRHCEKWYCAEKKSFTGLKPRKIRWHIYAKKLQLVDFLAVPSS